MTGVNKFASSKGAAESMSQREFERDLLQQVEDYRAGRMRTISLEDAEKILGLEK